MRTRHRLNLPSIHVKSLCHSFSPRKIVRFRCESTLRHPPSEELCVHPWPKLNFCQGRELACSVNRVKVRVHYTSRVRLQVRVWRFLRSSWLSSSNFGQVEQLNSKLSQFFSSLSSISAKKTEFSEFEFYFNVVKFTFANLRILGEGQSCRNVL